MDENQELINFLAKYNKTKALQKRFIAEQWSVPTILTYISLTKCFFYDSLSIILRSSFLKIKFTMDILRGFLSHPYYQEMLNFQETFYSRM